MILGFTGTSHGIGMTQRQSDTVRYLFMELQLSELHHGVCIRADAQAHRTAKKLGARIIGHPPIDPSRMDMSLNDFDWCRPPKQYLVRNRDIVAEGVDGLVAAPKDFIEPKSKRGQGTWTTIGYARKAGRRTWIVFPDGTFRVEQ
jgi:hypothetical protein